jgi:hypothetical protein
MTEEFKPQFPHALLVAGYQRWNKNRFMKLYVGCFRYHKTAVKFTNRMFKTATQAETHSKNVLARYARLVTAKMLSLAEVPA